MSLAQKLFESVVCTTIRGKKSSIRKQLRALLANIVILFSVPICIKKQVFIDKRGKMGDEMVLHSEGN